MNNTFQADNLWGDRYVLPPADRIFDPRGLEITGLVIPPNMSIVRVMTRSVASFAAAASLTVAASPFPYAVISGAGRLTAVGT